MGIREALGLKAKRNGEKRANRKPHGLKDHWSQKKPGSDYQNCPEVIRTGASEPEAARMKAQISFSKAVEGYLLAASARRLSEYTLLDYQNTFRKFLDFIDGDPPFDEIGVRDGCG